MKKTFFIIHTDKSDAVSSLTDEQAGKLLKAMFAFNLGNIPSFDDPVVQLAFAFFKAGFDADTERYERICARNQANGAKGGRPPKNDEPKKPNGLNENPKNPSEPKKANTNTNTNTEKDISIVSSSSKEDSSTIEVQDVPILDSAIAIEKPSDGIPQCPFKLICERFNERFAGRLPAVKIASPKRQAVVRQRWHDIFRDCGCRSEAEGLEAVNDYFDAIASHRWMFGENDRGWIASFDYIMSSRCYTKIYENSFHRKQVRR